MTTQKPKLTLDRLVIYEIQVPGIVDADWTNWVSGMTASTKIDANGQSTTVLRAAMDQAALQGLLHRLYGLGLPLIAISYQEPS